MYCPGRMAEYPISKFTGEFYGPEWSPCSTKSSLDEFVNPGKFSQIIPNVEKTLSRLLFDVQISRRKFQPITQVEDYRGRLRKLVTTILDYKVT